MPPPPELISFKYYNAANSVATYKAEKGMTWAEWVESEYNTDGFYLSNDVIKSSSGDNVYVSKILNESRDTVVAPGDVININFYYGDYYEQSGGEE